MAVELVEKPSRRPEDKAALLRQSEERSDKLEDVSSTKSTEADAKEPHATTQRCCRCCRGKCRGFWLCTLLAISVGVALIMSTDTDLYYCDRQCRWYLGFFERDIRGARNGSAHCSCTRVDEAAGSSICLGDVPYYTTDSAFEGPPTVPPTPISSASCCAEGDETPLANCTPTGHCHANVYTYAKPFDNATWADEYTTPWVCVLPVGASVPYSVREPTDVHAACMADGDAVADAACLNWKAAIEAGGDRILHCGVCSSCSSLHDLAVLEATKATITTDITGCSTSFVLSQRNPFGHESVADLKRCLVSKGVDFSDDGRAWAQRTNRPSCMDTWTDNILNDASLCVPYCWTKFLQTGNTGNFARDQCLQCDEYTSGPAFIKGAGANRRSAGITSDIDRTQLRATRWEQQICKLGFFAAPVR